MDKEKYLQIRQKIQFSIQPYHFYLHMVQDLALVGFSVYLCTSFGSVLGRLLAIPLISIFMFRAFAFMHDAVHGAVSKNNRINETVGVLWGAFCGLPFEPWKKSHLEHHFWSGNYQKDPVMALITVLPGLSSRVRKTLTFLWNFWIPSLAFLQQAVFWVLSVQNAWKQKSLSMWVSLSVAIAFWAILVFFVPPILWLTVLLPAVVLYLMAVEVVNLPHHLQLPMMEGQDRLPVWQQHLTARTCLYPRMIARFIALNFNYHTEHHMFPDAPWYYLEDLHTFINKELGSQQYMDPSFEWIRINRPKSLEEIIRTDIKVNTSSETAV